MKNNLIATLLFAFYTSSNAFAIDISNNIDINGDPDVSGDGRHYSENVNITNGIINISNDAELSADDHTISISGENTTINITTQGGMFSDKLILTGGTVNTSNGFFIGSSDFNMNGGELNVENSQIGGQGIEGETPEGITTISGGNTAITSGVININKGKAGWGSSTNFTEYDGNLLLSENISLGGTLNIAEGAGLETRTGAIGNDWNSEDEEMILNDEKSNIRTTTSGLINLGGTLVSDVSGQGTLAITSKNAVLDGNVSGVNLIFDTNNSLSNTINGRIENLSSLNISNGASLNYDKTIYGVGELNVSGNLNVSKTISTRDVNFKDGAQVNIGIGNKAEIAADDFTVTIDGNNTKVNIAANSGIFSNKINLNAGKVNVANGFFISESDFTMDGGELNIANSQFGGQGIESDTVSGGNTIINGGTININEGKAGWGSNTNFTEYDGNLLLSENILLGGTLNITEGTGLETMTGFIFIDDGTSEEVMVLNGDKSDIKTTTSGLINLGGTLVSNVSGQGTLAITSKNAVLDGNVSGVNVDVKSNISMANTFKGSLSANKTTIYDGSSLDLGIKTLQTNSLDVKDNGTLAFQVSGKNDGEYGKVKANSINISNVGTKLNLTLDNGVLAKNETKTFTILDSSNITGSFAELSKNSRYEFIDNSDGTFDITGKATAGDVAEDAGADDHKSVASAWLDGVEISGNSQAQKVVNILNTLSQTNPKEFVKALKTLAPVVAPMTHSSSQTQNQQLFNVAGGRMDSGSMGMSGGDTFEKVGLWAQGLYNKTKYSVSDGFDGKSTGIAFGADAYVADNTKLGLGFAYTKSDIDTTGRDVDVDNYSLFLYGEQFFEKLYVNGVLNYNFGKYNEKKNVAGISVKGDYNTNSIGAQILTGYNFNSGIAPHGGLRYAWTHQGSYTDTALQYVNSSNSNTLTALLGARYAHNFHKKGFNLIPEISAMLTYDLAHSNDSSVVSLANGSIYEISSDKLERFGGEVGVKLGFEINDFEISLKYEGQFKKDFTNNSGLINLRYNF